MNIIKNINRIKKGIREKGLFGFLKRLCMWLFQPLRPIVWFCGSHLVIHKLKNVRTRNKEELFYFSSRIFFSVIKPLQIKSEILNLLSIIEERRPKIVLEIGTSFGGVLFLLCKTIPEDSIIISLDLPGVDGGYPEWRKRLYNEFISNKQSLHLIKADSHDESSVKQIENVLHGKKVDFLFIDGDHTYDGVKRDFLMYRHLVGSIGIIAFHDIAHHSEDSGCEVDRFWGEIKKEYESLEIIEDRNQGWGGIGILYVKQ